MSILVRDFRYSDYKEIEKFIPYWKRKKLNYDIQYLNIEKMLKCLMFFNNDKLAMISGIDDVSEFIPNTFRILTRASTTKYRPRCWGEFLEEKFFSNIMAGISVNYCKQINNNINIVITTNEDSPITRLVQCSKNKWLKFREKDYVYDVKQVIWDIDIDECLKMTQYWTKQLNVKIENTNDRSY